AAQALRRSLRLPRHVALAEAARTLPVDLGNILSIRAFVSLIRARRQGTLVEMLPRPGELLVECPDGRCGHECVVAFVRQSKPTFAHASLRSDSSGSLSRNVARSFIPGSDWLYVKLYCGPESGDAVLREVVGPLVAAGRSSGLVQQWFFIRYGDPKWHLRL